MEKIKILVFGGGGVGSYFAGALNLDGHDVTLLTRGTHLNHIEKFGLAMKTHWGEFNSCIKVTEDTNEFYDVVILAVKTYSIKEIMPKISELSNPKNYIICLQNGTFTYNYLSKKIPNSRVLDGLTYVDASRIKPGYVDQFGEEAKIIIGNENCNNNKRQELLTLAKTLNSKRVQVLFSDEIQKSVWEKLIMVAASGSMMSFANTNATEIFADSKYSLMIKSMIKEMCMAAKSIGVNINEDFEYKTLEGLRIRSDELHSSLKEDLDNKRPLELDQILGEAIRTGKSNGIDMDVCEEVYQKLSPFIEGKKLP